MTEITMKTARDEYAYEIPGLAGESEHVRKQWNTLKYVDHLGSQTKTRVDGWNLNMFRGDTGAIITDRRKINEIFFKFRETLPPEVLQKESILDAEAAKRVHGLLIQMARSAEHTVNNEVRKHQTDVRTHASRLQNSKHELFNKSMTLKALKEMANTGANKVFEDVKRLLDNGFYTLASLQPDRGMAFLTEPITLSHFNESHGINQVVPMGRYRVVFSITNYGYLIVKVYAWDANPMSGDYIHPHVANGDVCWGNMSNAFHTYSAQCDFYNSGILLKDILKTYHGGNPFLELFNFFNAFKDGHVTDVNHPGGLVASENNEDELDRDIGRDDESEEPEEESEDNVDRDPF